MEPTIKIISQEVLSNYRYRFTKIGYEYTAEGSPPEYIERAVYNRGNGATILLFNPKTKSVLLTRQFRLPTYLNFNPSGMLLEVCAGTLDEESPEECIRRETEEETGYKIGEVKKVFEAYMSPGSVTEKLHFFIAEYTPAMKVQPGGGLEEEQEYIEVVEMPFEKAIALMNGGEIKDAKTLILLQYAIIHSII